MKGHAAAAEMRPLGHRFEVIDGFAGLDLDDPFQPERFVLRHEQEIRKHLSGADPNAGSLFVADIDGDFMLALEFRLQQTDHAVMLELLSNRPDQNRTHDTSGEPAMLTQVSRPV